MNEDISGFIRELRWTAQHETREWAADPANEHLRDRTVEDHVCWKAAVMLQAIFDPENQPSQYGTELIGAP